MMYPQNKPPHDEHRARKCVQIKACDPTIIHPIYVLIVALLLAASTKLRAEANSDNHAGDTQYDDFYQQLQKSDMTQYRPVYNNLLLRVTNEYSIVVNTRPDLLADQDLAFNYLWMLRYQTENPYKEGGAAAGKLIRMGVKALYKIYIGDITYSDKLKDDEIGGALSTMDYRLRVSSDKVKFGLKYEF
jgi:hypothetical protein